MNLPLTFSVALPLRGFTGFDSPPREEVPGPLPLATSSKAARFPGPERLVCDQFEPRAQPRMTLNLVDVACPARWKPHRTSSPAASPSLRWPRRPSFHGSGPDRLSPDRRPGMTTTCEGRVEDWPLSRSVSLRHLLSRARGSAGWRGQRFRALARPFRAHLGFPPCLRRPFSLKGRFLPSPATGRTLGCTQGAFPSESSLRRRRTRPGKPSKDLCFHGGEPLSTGCSQAVEKGPALLSSHDVPSSDGAKAREGAG